MVNHIDLKITLQTKIKNVHSYMIENVHYHLDIYKKSYIVLIRGIYNDKLR